MYGTISYGQNGAACPFCFCSDDSREELSKNSEPATTWEKQKRDDHPSPKETTVARTNVQMREKVSQVQQTGSQKATEVEKPKVEKSGMEGSKEEREVLIVKKQPLAQVGTKPDTEPKKSSEVVRHGSSSRNDPSKRQTIAFAASPEKTVFGERKVTTNRSSVHEPTVNWDALDKPKDRSPPPEDVDTDATGGTEFAKMLNRFKDNASRKKAATEKEAQALERGAGRGPGVAGESRKFGASVKTTAASSSSPPSKGVLDPEHTHGANISRSASLAARTTAPKVHEPAVKGRTFSDPADREATTANKEKEAKTMVVDKPVAKAIIVEKKSHSDQASAVVKPPATKAVVQAKTVEASGKVQQPVKLTIVEKQGAREPATSASDVKRKTVIVEKQSSGTAGAAIPSASIASRKEALPVTGKKEASSKETEPAKKEPEDSKPLKAVTLVVEGKRGKETQNPADTDSKNNENLLRKKASQQAGERPRSSTLPEHEVVRSQASPSERRGQGGPASDRIKRSQSMKPVSSSKVTVSGQGSSSGAPEWIALAHRKTKDWKDRDPDKENEDKKQKPVENEEVGIRKFPRM